MDGWASLSSADGDGRRGKAIPCRREPKLQLQRWLHYITFQCLIISPSESLSFRGLHDGYPQLILDNLIDSLSPSAAHLFPLVISLLIFPPGYIQAEFPAPRCYKQTGTRIISIQIYPAARDIFFLIIIFLADIIFLYPYTQAGSCAEISLLYQTTGVFFLCMKFTAAVACCFGRIPWRVFPKRRAPSYNR